MKEGFGAPHLFQGKVALDSTFVFYLNRLKACFAVWNVPEVNYRFKLDVRSWAQCVHLKLERLTVSLTSDFNRIVEFSLSVCLKLDVKSNGEAGGDTAEVFVVTTELLSLRPAELDTLHILG